MARKFQELSDRMAPERRARAEARAQAVITKGMSLRDLRDTCEMTQVELAKKMDATQSEVSKIEQRTDYLVSTLRDYVEALGAELDIIARFPDGGEVRLRQDVAVRDKVGAL